MNKPKWIDLPSLRSIHYPRDMGINNPTFELSDLPSLESVTSGDAAFIGIEKRVLLTSKWFFCCILIAILLSDQWCMISESDESILILCDKWSIIEWWLICCMIISRYMYTIIMIAKKKRKNQTMIFTMTRFT